MSMHQPSVIPHPLRMKTVAGLEDNTSRKSMKGIDFNDNDSVFEFQSEFSMDHEMMQQMQAEGDGDGDFIPR
jgi:hypothetical protein